MQCVMLIQQARRHVIHGLVTITAYACSAQLVIKKLPLYCPASEAVLLLLVLAQLMLICPALLCACMRRWHQPRVSGAALPE